MALGTLHKLDKIVMPSSVEFSKLTNVRWNKGIESLVERPAGHPHPMFRANLSQKPVLSFTTSELSILLAAIGVGGAAVGSTATYWKVAAATGSVARATTSHKKITIASSIGHFTTIRLPHNGKAEADVVLTAIYDGVNDPFVYAASQALSGNLAAGLHFGCGPVYLNNTLVPGVKEITIESGVQLIQEGDASEEFDTFVGIEMTAPKVTVRFLNQVNLATYGLRGTALDGTNGIKFFARKFCGNTSGGISRVADGTAEHIKFQGILGSIVPQETAGDGSGLLTDTLVAELVASSDSVVPLVITTGSAIS